MANHTFYYKITDKAVVEQFKAILQKKSDVYQQMLDFAHRLGFEGAIASDTRAFGLCLAGFANPKEGTDLQYYKRSKEGRYTPKKTSKAFYQTIADEYEALVGARGVMPFVYDEMDRLLIKNHHYYSPGWFVPTGIAQDEGVIAFCTNDAPAQTHDYTIEITASEYQAIANKSQKQNAE